MKGRARLLALSLASAAMVSGAPAAAQVFDPRAPEDLPDAPSPPSLPDLTHRALYASVEITAASVHPNDAGGVPSRRVFNGIFRAEGELSIGSSRRWFLGVGEELAGGGRGTSTIVPSYPELWGRGVWASRAGLAYGGGLGVVVPFFSRAPDSEEAEASRAARVVKPWSFSLFSDNTLTVRPFLDARVIDGNVTLQLRQSFELQGLVADARLPTRSLVSRTTFYLGYQPVKQLGLGMEVTELYFISATRVCLDGEAKSSSSSSAPSTPVCTTLTDDLRSAFVVSPSLRFLIRDFQPAVSAILPFGQTLLGEAKSFWALRLTLGGVFDGPGRSTTNAPLPPPLSLVSRAVGSETRSRGDGRRRTPWAGGSGARRSRSHLRARA